MAYNIIFYFSDQQRWDTCGCFGQPLNITPNLDKLAAEGVKFDNAFSPQPVCGPCRALFQTGKYPTETGCFRNNLMLPSNIKTLGEYMEKRMPAMRQPTSASGTWLQDGELEKSPPSTTPSPLFRWSCAVAIPVTGVQPMCWSLPPTATTAMCLTRTTTASISRATGPTASTSSRWTTSTSTPAKKALLHDRIPN